MQSLPKQYNFAEIERKWQARWEADRLYQDAVAAICQTFSLVKLPEIELNVREVAA